MRHLSVPQSSAKMPFGKNLFSTNQGDNEIHRKPIRYAQIAVFLALLTAVLVMVRTAGKKVHLADNPMAPPMPVTPAEHLLGCTPTKDFFYYDLGGTECVCDKHWSRTPYWEKLMTGFAFNFPHVVSPFHFYVILGRWEYIMIGVFINEVCEELLLGVAGKWGFVFDPPYDLESRYDSLIRDFFCCISGLILGIQFCRIFKVRPMFDTPIKLTWDPQNKHSVGRILIGLAQSLIVWQITLVYNTDKGMHAFNPSNLILILGYASAVSLIYFNNRHYWPECSPRHVLCWHIGWIFCICYIFSFTVYPLLDGMYLVLIAEVSLEMILHTADFLISGNIWNIRTKLGMDDNAVDVDTREELILSYDGLSVPNMKENLWIADIPVALGQLKMRHGGHIPVCTVEELLEQLECVKQQRNCNNKVGNQVSMIKKMKLAVWLIVGTVLLIILVMGPLQFTGEVMYTRHWCGNPSVMKNGIRVIQNGCVGM